MNNLNNVQMGCDLTAISNKNLESTTEFSVFFLYNERVEVAAISDGGKRN